MISFVLFALPAAMAIFGYLMIFFPTDLTLKLVGFVLMLFSGILGTAILVLLRLISPSAFRIITAKLKKLDILLVFTENRKYIPLIGKFDSGWVWIRDRLGYIVSSTDDVGYLDGVPLYVAYRGVGKTLNLKAIVDLQILEKVLGVEADKFRSTLLKAIRSKRGGVTYEDIRILAESKQAEQATGN